MNEGLSLTRGLFDVYWGVTDLLKKWQKCFTFALRSNNVHRKFLQCHFYRDTVHSGILSQSFPKEKWLHFLCKTRTVTTEFQVLLRIHHHRHRRSHHHHYWNLYQHIKNELRSRVGSASVFERISEIPHVDTSSHSNIKITCEF